MDHARTAIAMKMLFREVTAAGLALTPGRHWDVLLGLLKSLRRDQPTHVVEIGVACGQNAGHLLRNVPKSRYTGIDPTIFDEVRRRLSIFDDRVQLWAERSQDVVDRFPNHSIDLLFIDGPHTYERTSYATSTK